jgi:transposase
VIKLEDWITVKNLKQKNPAIGTRKIAELLGVSRNTVKKALKKESPPEYKRNNIVNPDIAPFKDYIVERIILKRLKGSRVLKEIISKGYKGSQSAFYRYLNKIRTEEKRTYQRYETAPAEQAQFDWSPYTVIINSIKTKVYIFSYILGFSRYRIYEASLSENQSSVFEAIENSVQEIGGVTEKLQTDNARCFVKNASRENFQWNERYLAFAGFYGIKPQRSLPSHPWSKGKVENPFKYLEDHFIDGNEYNSIQQFIKKLKEFQSEVNSRVHQTTKAKPVDLLEKEKSFLFDLPETRYVSIKEEARKATADCLISFGGNRYSVPYIFASKEVWVKVSRGYILEIYSANNLLIAAHYLSTEKGRIIMDKEHYRNHKVERGNLKRMSDCFIELFPEEQWFLDKLKTQKKINPHYHLTQLLELSNYYPKEEIKAVLKVARDYNTYSYIFIKGYLERYSELKQEQPSVLSRLHTEHTAIDIKRPLSYYKLK